mgnify:CR=1 FL=1
MVKDCGGLEDEVIGVVGEEIKREGCDCILFSGGIDTGLVALSAVLAGLRPRLLTVLYEGSTDERYARYAAEVLGLELHIMRPPTDLLLRCVDEALQAIETIDPIEVVSAAAVCSGLLKAKDLGCRCVATGDGGDELFIGYDFLLNRGPRELSAWLQRVIDGAFFNSIPMGARLGVKVVLPLYCERIKEIALRSLEEGCSVRERGERKFGKYLLRSALDRHSLGLIAWRPKDPITRGSGAQTLLDIMRGMIGANEAIRLSSTTMIRLPSFPHAYLLKRRIQLRAPIPPRVSGPGSCPVCGRALRGDHCPFCGAYVGGGEVSVYSDELLEVIGRRTVS